MQAENTDGAVRYFRHPSVLAAALGTDELALLGASREDYFGLNGPGARIWSLIETPRTLDEVCDVLLAEFDVEPEACRRDARELLAEMVAHGLAVEQLAG